MSPTAAQPKRFDQFFWVLGISQVAVLVLYFTVVSYNPNGSGATTAGTLAGLNVTTSSTGHVSSFYSLYSHVAFMIFIGFGFLMTFLKKYGFSSVGLNFLVASVVVEWAILMAAFWEKVHEEDNGIDAFSHKIFLSVDSFITGNFGAGAVLISFGAVLGKINPTQLLVMGLMETFFWSLNAYIGEVEMQAIDMGGSIFIHTFGAYFGMAACYFVSSKATGADHPKNGSDKTSDMFAMIGTLFLWLLWPSFNGALAPDHSQFRVIINTILALIGSCTSAFFFSRLFALRFDMVLIQNATLAGGVGVGSSADLVIGPGMALFLGQLAGFISVAGYQFLSPRLEKLGIRDTCGVHNLHGLPGIQGGIAGAIATAVAWKDRNDLVYGVNFNSIFPRGEDQASIQVAALGVSLGVAIVGGAFTGFVIRYFKTDDDDAYAYDDALYWEVPSDDESDVEMAVKSIGSASASASASATASESVSESASASSSASGSNSSESSS